MNGLNEHKFKNIVVVAGAGISCGESSLLSLVVASGIPDFRSANGLYRNLNKYPVPYLRDPSTIFDYYDFQEYSTPFWILAKEMFYTNDQYHPTPCHFFLQLLAQKGLLRRVFTQNIDGLERKAGLAPPTLIEGHGTCSQCACVRCKQAHGTLLQQVWRADQAVDRILWGRPPRRVLSLCDEGLSGGGPVDRDGHLVAGVSHVVSEACGE